MENLVVFFFVIFFIWMLFLTLNVFNFYRKQKLVLQAASKEDLPQLIIENRNNIKKIVEEIEEIKEISVEIQQSLKKSIQNVGIVRFDAFENAGGKISYSIALLDNQGDGVLITTLNGRTDSRSYAKSITRGESDYSLSDEEKESIKIAFRNK